MNDNYKISHTKEFEELIHLLNPFECSTNWEDLNKTLIPVNRITAYKGSEAYFNIIYQQCLKCRLNDLKMTKSGGISIDFNERMNLNKYKLLKGRTNVELIICLCGYGNYRIQYGINNVKNEETTEDEFVSGGQANKQFWKECKRFGIYEKDYITPEEERNLILQTITPPDINLYCNKDEIYNNVYHIDFHKFYASGLILSHPEFKPIIELWNKRAKKDKRYKVKLACLSGFWRSKYCNYKFVGLARDMINTAYDRFNQVKLDLYKNDYEVLATNTDGIFIIGDYHNKNLFEGDNLGEWSIDKKNIKIRFKSTGSYEYIDNKGKYHPVVRGTTTLDREKPRSDWEWGDIYKTSIMKWKFEEEVGIVWITED